MVTIDCLGHKSTWEVSFIFHAQVDITVEFPLMRHTFSIGDRSRLQVGQSSTCTRCLRSRTVVTCAEWGLTLSWSSWEKVLAWWQHVSKISLHINGTFCQAESVKNFYDGRRSAKTQAESIIQKTKGSIHKICHSKSQSREEWSNRRGTGTQVKSQC